MKKQIALLVFLIFPALTGTNVTASSKFVLKHADHQSTEAISTGISALVAYHSQPSIGARRRSKFFICLSIGGS